MKRPHAWLLLLPLGFLPASGAAAPASPEARLQCALDRVPAESRRAFSRLYAAEKSRADMEGVIPGAAYRQMATDCLASSPDDLEQRGSRLGQAVMSWHLMHLAQASLEAHHQVSALALDEAYQALRPTERAKLIGQDPQAIVIRLTARLRPDLVGAQDRGRGDQAYFDLIEDVAVYASSRAVMEAVAGDY